MADLTLSDFVKTLPDGKQRTVINTYAMETHVTQMLPMADAPTGTFSYDINHDLPYQDSSASATRVMNGNFTSTKAGVQKFEINNKVYGGKIAYDRAAAKINKAEVVRQQRLQVMAKARQFTKDVFEGTGGEYLRGIKNIIDTVDVYKPQIVYVGGPSVGSALTEDKLDEALSLHNIIMGSTYIYCTRKVNLRAKKMSRGTGSTSAYSAYNLNYRPEEFGRFNGAYADVPIVPLIDGKGDDILSTTSDICNVYIVTYGDENFTGFQVSSPDTYNLEGTSAVREWDLEHLVGTAPQSQKCITMLKYVANSQT